MDFTIAFQRQRFPITVLLKLRALLRASAVTNLLVARVLRLESVVERLEGEIEVREIVQPVCPPRSNVIKPCSGHSCSESRSTARFPLETLPLKYSQTPRKVKNRKKETRLQLREQSPQNTESSSFAITPSGQSDCHYTPVPIGLHELLNCATAQKPTQLQSGPSACIRDMGLSDCMNLPPWAEKAWQPFFSQVVSGPPQTLAAEK